MRIQIQAFVSGETLCECCLCHKKNSKSSREAFTILWSLGLHGRPTTVQHTIYSTSTQHSNDANKIQPLFSKHSIYIFPSFIFHAFRQHQADTQTQSSIVETHVFIWLQAFYRFREPSECTATICYRPFSRITLNARASASRHTLIDCDAKIKKIKTKQKLVEHWKLIRHARRSAEWLAERSSLWVMPTFLYSPIDTADGKYWQERINI